LEVGVRSFAVVQGREADFEFRVEVISDRPDLELKDVLARMVTDRPAQRVAKSGKATGTAGTITLGQGKAISSRAIEKATGGKNGGGCDRKDIQKQLDEQFKAHNDTLLRGVKDSRRVTDAIKNAVTRKDGDI
jgi:hypothetical protein